MDNDLFYFDKFCYFVLMKNEFKGRTTFYRSAFRGPCGTFAGEKVRLAKIAQYITIFLLSAVAPYLRTPGEDFFGEGE